MKNDIIRGMMVDTFVQVVLNATRTISLLAGVIVSFAASAEKANVIFIHGANVSLQEEKAWASEMFKRLWQAGADMEFLPVSWESDIGPSYNYQVNVSNAFVVAARIAPMINSEQGRNVVIAHSLGTVVAAAAIQDYGARVDKLIMLNSAIPAEAFDPSLADVSPQNRLVHDEWVPYTNACWSALWHTHFPHGDARRLLTWRGRFADVARVAVNFYSSGDEVLELYAYSHNPSWYNGFSPSGNWGERYSWHKQELYKGRKWLLGFIGTTYWSGWGFRENALGVNVWTASEANSVDDVSVFATNMVFNPYPPSITNSVATRLETDFHLSQGIPALSPPAGRTCFETRIMPSFDMNSTEFMSANWPTGNRNAELQNRWLHSDVKDMAYFFTHRLFRKIVEVGGFGQ